MRNIRTYIFSSPTYRHQRKLQCASAFGPSSTGTAPYGTVHTLLFLNYWQRPDRTVPYVLVPLQYKYFMEEISQIVYDCTVTVQYKFYVSKKHRMYLCLCVCLSVCLSICLYVRKYVCTHVTTNEHQRKRKKQTIK